MVGMSRVLPGEEKSDCHLTYSNKFAIMYMLEYLNSRKVTRCYTVIQVVEL